MKNNTFKRYFLFVCIGLLIASFYPLLMGVRVITDMIFNSTVMKEAYPKYIIPYTPLSIALIVGVAAMPLLLKRLPRLALLLASAAAVAVFFAVEVLFEQKIVVTAAGNAFILEDWQMYMCYAPLEDFSHKTLTAVEILMGNYDPSFKFHFYIISVVLILTVLNCLYGFGQMAHTGEGYRKNALILQSVATGIFLGLCILACFTAFWRDGALRVSPLSALLMTVFFILLGMTVGVYAGSFLLEKGPWLSVCVPAVLASLVTLLMYIGELILLNGHLYILGNGAFFASIPGIVFAPADLMVILASGAMTAALFAGMAPQKAAKT